MRRSKRLFVQGDNWDVRKGAGQMKNILKRVLPGCLGACVGAFLVETLRHPGARGIGDWIFRFAVTTAVVALIFWLWERVRGKNHPESR